MADSNLPYSGPIVTRAEARALGLKRYFTGKACSRGHIGERSYSGGECIACRKILNSKPEHLINVRNYERNRRATEGDVVREAARQRYATHRSIIRSQQKAWNERNKDYLRNWNHKKYHADIEASRQYQRERRAANLEKFRADGRARYWAEPALWAARNRANYQGDLISRRAKMRAYYKANKATFKTWYLAAYKAHPERYIARAAARRARIAEVGGSYTAADILAILKLQRHRCAYCSADLNKVRWEIDHVLPIQPQPGQKGGDNSRKNLQATCRPCNRRKNNKDPIAWAKELGKLI
jgi:5-methylcytosine-specific restriction endonuclease McrA